LIAANLSGPVGKADGSSGDLPSVWAEGDDKVDVDVNDGKEAAKQYIGKGNGGNTSPGLAAPPGKRVRPN
jgi:hypothetical protein